MQGTRAWSLIQEDSTCRRATKPRCHHWAHALQLRKPVHRNGGGRHNEKPTHRSRDPAQPKINKPWRKYMVTAALRHEAFEIIYLSYSNRKRKHFTNKTHRKITMPASGKGRIWIVSPYTKPKFFSTRGYCLQVCSELPIFPKKTTVLRLKALRAIYTPPN